MSSNHLLCPVKKGPSPRWLSLGKGVPAGNNAHAHQPLGGLGGEQGRCHLVLKASLWVEGSSGCLQEVMVGNDVCPEERGLWALGHKGRTGPCCPVTFMKFFFTTH